MKKLEDQLHQQETRWKFLLWIEAQEAYSHSQVFILQT